MLRLLLTLTILSLPLVAQEKETIYRCPGGEQIRVHFQPETTTVHGTRTERAVVAIDGYPRITLPRAASASGARYSDGFTTLWNKGDEILLEAGSLNVKGCRIMAQGPDRGESTSSLEGRWELTELAGKSVNAERKPQIEFRPGEQRAAGFGGCNRFSGSYKTDGDKLSFGAIASTFMACPGPMMQVEDSFFKALEGTARYRISSGVLELLNPSGQTLVKFQRQ